MIFLFDIDGTLIRCEKAGSNSMNKTFEELFGVKDAFMLSDFRGGLDDLIVASVFERENIPLSRIPKFKSRYFLNLKEAMCKKPGVVLPGVERLLNYLGPNIGLITGNWREGAQIKLEAYDLWKRFPKGAFSEDGRSRNELVQIMKGNQKAVVFGDTQSDMVAAKNASALGIAVLTGWTDSKDLQIADLIVEDLETGFESIIKLIGEL